MTTGAVATRIAEGMYRVEHDGRSEVVYVAGPPQQRWAFWKGRVFVLRPEAARNYPAEGITRARPAGTLTAPMPATVVKVLVSPGSAVRKGDAVILLEAMKMELPIRAAEDATVTAVHCREGELVQPDTPLVELE